MFKYYLEQLEKVFIIMSSLLRNLLHYQHKPHHVLHRFQYFVLLHSTTSHHKYRIYQTRYKAKPIKFVIKLYTDRDTLWVKHATYQKAESLRPASPSYLDNMFNNSSKFNAKYAEFSTKWYALLHFHSPSCGYNQRCNLYQETVPLLQSIFTCLFHPYFFTKSSLQSSLTLPSYINQQFFNHLNHFDHHFQPILAYNHPNNLHQKYFPYLKHFVSSGCVKVAGS